MVKRAQIIRWLLPTNSLSVFDHFVGLALKGLILGQGLIAIFCDPCNVPSFQNVSMFLLRRTDFTSMSTYWASKCSESTMEILEH